MAFTNDRAREVLASLGVPDAAAWAEGEERQPMVARYLFLRGLWASVVGDDAWMHRFARADDPVPQAIARVLAAGVAPGDLTTIVRAMQVAVAYDAAQLVDDPAHGIEALQEKVPENVEWRLVEWDGEADRAGRPIRGAHQRFHALDPRAEPPAPKAARRASRAKKP